MAIPLGAGHVVSSAYVSVSVGTVLHSTLLCDGRWTWLCQWRQVDVVVSVMTGGRGCVSGDGDGGLLVFLSAAFSGCC